MGDYNTSKKSVQLEEKEASVREVIDSLKSFPSLYHWGLLIGAEGHVLECFLPSPWNFPPSNFTTHTHFSFRDSSSNLL